MLKLLEFVSDFAPIQHCTLSPKAGRETDKIDRNLIRQKLETETETQKERQTDRETDTVTFLMS